MKLKFLCDGHRDLLTNSPEKALKTCLGCNEQGNALLKEHRYADAVPYMGNAYEAAEILLTNRSFRVGTALDWYLCAASGLTEALELLDRRAEAKEVYLMTMARLRRELPLAPGQRMQIAQQLQWIQVKLRMLEAPATLCETSNVVMHPTASRAVH